MPSPTVHHDFKSLTELPDTHAWPSLNEDSSVDPAGHEAIPVIDLSDTEDRKVIHLVGQACTEPGIFHIIGHGIPVELLSNLEAQTQRFFSLPAEQKRSVARTPENPTGYGSALVYKFPKMAWSEGFTIIGSPRDHVSKLWPQDHNHFCDVIDEYIKLATEVANKLMRMILLYLGLSEDEAQQVSPQKKLVLQLNYYPACPDPERAIGLPGHTDSSFITLLYQGNVNGLQHFKAEGKSGPARWLSVPPMPGAIIVNVGDLLEVLSNGRLHSAMHRAVVNRVQDRISIPFFCGPAAHIKVSPHEKILGPEEGPKFRAVTWPEYVEVKQKHLNNSLTSIRN